MAQFIVTAAKLNKRNVIPAFLPDANSIAGIVFKNFIFEGDEVTTVPNPGLGKWYKDRDGFFYWGGALAMVAPPTDAPLPPSPSPAPLAGSFTVAQIKAATGATTANAQKFAPFINDTCTRFKINTPVRGLCFLAQVGHESGGLFFTEELASGKAYEGRKDLGNTHAGDGVRFKGRGLIQITGRANYQSLSDVLGVDLISSPAFLGGKNINTCTPEQMKNAALSAGWFWDKHKINAMADKININEPIQEDPNFDHFEAVTKAINGGTNGIIDRVARYNSGIDFFA